MRSSRFSVLRFDTVGSTNDVAADLAARRPVADRRAQQDPILVVRAEQQTAGRGRRGHTWFSPQGSGLYVSVVLAPQGSVDPRRATLLLTIAVGAALAEAVEAATGLRVDLKWPNDLYVARRKLAGILAEACAAGGGVDAVVVGYGINVGPMAYPPELADCATSLESELGRPIDRESLFDETLATIAARHDDLLAGRFNAILDAWRRRAPSARGARVAWTTPEGERAGTTRGIDDDGALLVDVAGATERVVSGELIWFGR